MNLKLIFCACLGLVVCANVNAQNRLYLGLEANYTNDEFNNANPDSFIKAPEIDGVRLPSVSLLLGYEITEVLHFETGIINKVFRSGYSVSNISGGFGSNGYSSGSRLQIPLRLRANIPLIESKLYLQPFIGYHIGFTGQRIQEEVSYGYRSNTSDRFSAQDSASFQVFSNRYDLFEAGIGINYRINNKLVLDFNVSTLKGNTPIEKYNIFYEDSEGVSEQNSIINSGAYTSFNLGLKYRFKKFR